MPGRILSTLMVLLFICGCSDNKKEKNLSSMDTARDFIRASLDGDFRVAEQSLLQDTQNLELFASYKSYYQRLSGDKKQHYKDAGYTINKWVDSDDSTTIINYSNDYMNKPMEIKLIKTAGNWKVDFKYTYSGNLPIN